MDRSTARLIIFESLAAPGRRTFVMPAGANHQRAATEELVKAARSIDVGPTSVRTANGDGRIELLGSEVVLAYSLRGGKADEVHLYPETEDVEALETMVAFAFAAAPIVYVNGREVTR